MSATGKAKVINFISAPFELIIWTAFALVITALALEAYALALNPLTKTSDYLNNYLTYASEEGLWKAFLMPVTLIFGSVGAYLLYSRIPTWGQARSAGINMVSYESMKRLFLLAAILELPFAYYAVTQDLSWQSELIAIGFLAVMILSLYYMLKTNREKFNPKRFRVLMAPATGTAAPFLDAIENLYSLRLLPEFMQKGLSEIINILNPAFLALGLKLTQLS